MSFRIWTIFYVMAVVAASLAVFGEAGLFVAMFVLGFWGFIYWPELPMPPAQRLLWCLVVFGAFLLLVALLTPARSAAREAGPRTSCWANTKMLALALQAYQEDNGGYPPAYLTDAHGEPMLSWRVLVLPYAEEQSLYDRFELTKPWDDPANDALSATDLELHHCPSDPSRGPMTNYLAVVGPHAAWPGGHGRPQSEFTDDPSETILLIETHGRGVRWAEPRDLTFDEAVDLLSQPLEPENGHRLNSGLFYKKSPVLHVAFADGQARPIRLPLDRKLAEALLTVDGGEPIDREAIEVYTSPELDYTTCYAFGVFVVLAVLPAAWLGRRRKAEKMVTTEDSQTAGEP